MEKKTFITTLIIVFCIMAMTACVQQTEGDAGKIVGEYTGDQLAGFEEIIESSENFDLGANKYGQPIFADRDKAYMQMLSTCEAAIEAIKGYGDMPDLTKHNIEMVPVYSAKSLEMNETEYNEDILKQAAFIGVFYDICCHSDSDFYN